MKTDLVNIPRFVTLQAHTLDQLVEKMNIDGLTATNIPFIGRVDTVDDSGDPVVIWRAVLDFVVPVVMPFEQFEYLQSLNNDGEMNVEVEVEDNNAVSGGYKKTNSA